MKRILTFALLSEISHNSSIVNVYEGLLDICS